MEDTDAVSATELVTPHLPMLSQFWLAALKDYAYLSLPGQFSSQLPRAGGTFYTPPIIPLVVPYYEANWPSLLHAAAIWAQFIGLRKKPDRDSQWKESSTLPAFAGVVPLTTSLAPSTDERYDLFHLLIGLSVQMLCTPEVFDTPHTIRCCLLALRRLINTRFACSAFLTEKQLTMELLSLFRRLLLTCRDASLQLTTLHIAMLVANALKEPKSLNAGEEKEKEEEEREEVKEDLKEDIMEHGKSLAYSILELSACCLFRLIPGLSLAGLEDKSPPVEPHQRKKALSPVEVEMVATAVQLLPAALSLCSDEALAQVLAPALYLTLSVVRFISLLSSPPPHHLTSCLQTVRNLCMQLQPSHQTTTVLHATLWSLLGEGREADPARLHDIPTETRLVLVAMVLLAPAAVCPPGSELSAGCVKFMETCLSSSQAEVRGKSTTTVLVLSTCGVKRQNVIVSFSVHSCCFFQCPSPPPPPPPLLSSPFPPTLLSATT